MLRTVQRCSTPPTRRCTRRRRQAGVPMRWPTPWFGSSGRRAMRRCPGLRLAARRVGQPRREPPSADSLGRMSDNAAQSKAVKAVIPAAGLATRFLPATKAVPKELLPVVDRPVLQYIVEEAAAAGIRDILLVTGRGKTSMVDHFDRQPYLESRLEAKGDKEKLARVRPPSELAEL